ncbi:FG-GAP-like repeat-containing protein [Amycolatopsis sp. Hca4]|uniref:FG-GAP-like repeat-containing protein n=1 Tax=Amycolatopsis sp. Hca4 TaxID=2742131 RepID=UPI00158FBCEB|nr:FG-GAP-like repeat-containing protein [Amycolatopsis sp. Hca4]QKV73817.1 trypsin-like serine protease [Amycolatopsis sp. Hca4]
MSGGAAAPEGSYGYAARVVVNGTTAGCSGAVVAQGWVITAKRCFGQNVPDGPPPQPTTVSFGPGAPGAGPLPVVDRLVPAADRDVVLAHVTSPSGASPLPSVTPVAIAATAPASGETVRIGGFGRTATEWVPARLNTASYTVQGVTATSMSVTAAGGANDPCKGDAGGPALRETGDRVELAGVTSASWQHGCLAETETRSGAVVARVDDLAGWIAEQTKPLTATPSRMMLADLDGDGRAELLAIHPNGDVHAWHNDGGFGGNPWNPADIVVATDMRPGRTYFADLDGDHKADIVSLWDNGEGHAWHNVRGFSPMPWEGASIVVTTGIVDPQGLKFADLDGDGRAEAMSVDANGDVRAWRNARGFAPMPWEGGSIVVGADMKPATTFFADLDGDGKADIISVWENGEGHAWHNVRGFSPMPWEGASIVVAAGFPDVAPLRFADLDGDHRADAIAVDPQRQIRAWHNGAGYAVMPWDALATIATPYVP